MNILRYLLLATCVVAASSASAITVTCASEGDARTYCRVNTAQGVQLVGQRSESPCTQGYSWGYDRGGIWVDHGCRADFTVAAQGSGNYARGVSPQEAQRACKNTAGERLPGVPLAYISVYRGTDTGDGSYMINFRAQPPNARSSSGFCIIARSGQMQRFEFDRNSGGNYGGGGGNGGNGGGGGGGGGGGYHGVSPDDAMRACKTQVSSRRPDVPLAFIRVDQASPSGGGAFLVNFRALPPNGRAASGYCNVAANGYVDLRFDNQ